MNEIISLKDKAEIWRERIESQVSSQQTVRAFCLEREISPQTFHYWKKKFCDLRRKGLAGRFVKITKGAQVAGTTPRIHLPNGVKIELGESLESVGVSEFIRSLCGVGHPPKDGHHAKP